MRGLSYIVKLDTFEFDSDKTNSGWLHVFSLGTMHHPEYGYIDITPERVQRFSDNVNNRVIGTDVPIDFSHMRGPDGERAAGWSKLAEPRDTGLWLFVDWTPRAAGEIRNGEWKYASAMFNNTWKDQHGHEYQDVLNGAALTNHPFLADLTPVNLMAFADDPDFEWFEDDEEHIHFGEVDNSTWDGNAAMTACKTASDYRAICAGRRAGDPNKRETWALPHHKRPGAPPNADGVRNALARLPQTQGLVNKDGAQRHLNAHMSSISPQNASVEGGAMDRKMLAAIFGLPEDATEEQLVEKAKTFAEFFTSKTTEEEKVRKFAEDYPEEAKRLAERDKEVEDLRKGARLSEINTHLTNLTDESGKFKLSPATIEALREVRAELTEEADKKFATVIEQIVSKDALVEFGERGSSGEGTEDDEITFAGEIEKLRKENKDLSYAQAYEQVKTEQPKLAEAEAKRTLPKGGE